MSDFLTRMAQLSRGETAVVTPQLPSLFSPSEEAPPAETGGAPLLQQNAAGPLASAFEPGSENRDNVLQAEPADRLESPAKDPPGSQPPSSTLAAAETAAEPRKAVKGEDHFDPFEATILQGNNRQTDANRADRSGQKKPESDPQNVEPAGRMQKNPESPLVSIDPPNAQSQSERWPSAPLVTNYQSRQAAPQQLMAELPTIPEPAADQEPTIHINIGQIEVRAQSATPAPVARPTPPKPPSSLSLDSYLKRSGRRS